jgi:hypothetical protein
MSFRVLVAFFTVLSSSACFVEAAMHDGGAGTASETKRGQQSSTATCKLGGAQCNSNGDCCSSLCGAGTCDP